MRGTEKQIAWATDIKNRLLHYISLSDENAEKDLPNITAEQLAEHRWCLRIYRQAIESIGYAGTIIQYFRHIPYKCKEDEYKDGLKWIIAVFRVCPEMTTLIRKTTKEMEASKNGT